MYERPVQFKAEELLELILMRVKKMSKQRQCWKIKVKSITKVS